MEQNPAQNLVQNPGRRKKILFWSFMVLGGASILFLIWVGLNNLKQVHLFLTPTAVAKKSIRSQVVFPGNLDFTQHSTLQFQQIPSSGVMISWVGVKLGDKVTKGQTIATLDTQAIFKQQQINLNSYWKQRLTYDQNIANNNGAFPASAINDTQKRLLQQNQVDLDQTVYNVELQDIVQRLSNLVTPIDGIITRVDTPNAGVNIQTADQAVFEVINPNSVFFSANIDEAEIANLHVGDRGVVILNAYPADFIQATITDIAFASHADANGNTVFTTRLNLNNRDNSDYKFKNGMTGNIIFYEYADNILTIPNDYIHQDDNGSYVYVGRDKKKTYVQTGISDGNITEVIKGVAKGDVIYY